MKRIGMTVAIAVALGVVGCTTMTPQQQGTVSGAAIGAAAGAGIAAICGGQRLDRRGGGCRRRRCRWQHQGQQAAIERNRLVDV